MALQEFEGHSASGPKLLNIGMGVARMMGGDPTGLMQVAGSAAQEGSTGAKMASIGSMLGGMGGGAAPASLPGLQGGGNYTDWAQKNGMGAIGRKLYGPAF